jgi:hypothetical protein
MAVGFSAGGVTSLPDTAAAGVHTATTTSLLAYLLAESSHGDRQAREALYFTFNVDLGFFETRLLGVSRASGAAVTLVADAHMYAPDPRAVRGAGTSYVVGLASMSGAFHPKLSVLVGPERAVIAIGSGNVTVNGWHHNQELSTVITADRGNGCPLVVADVSAWIRSLPDLVPINSLAVAALGRTADQLDALIAIAPAIDTGHQLVTTSTSAILTQLPNDHVEHLGLYAPFHDHDGAALRALLNRYHPSTVSLAVQPGQTVMTPSALVAAAQSVGAVLTVEDAGDKYRHGKLIEARRDDGTGWTLTGSPNLTVAALLKSLERGGNCEVGLVSRLTESLYPGGGTLLSADHLPIFKIDSPESVSSQTPAGPHLPTLIGATLIGDQIRIELARSASTYASVQVSRFVDLPENYDHLGDIGPEQTIVFFPAPEGLGAGSRVRVAVPAADGRIWGSDVYLTDPQLVTRRARPGGGSHANDDLDPVDFFGDLKVADRWTKALNTLLNNQHRVPLPRASVSTVGVGVGVGDGDGDGESVSVSSAEGWRTLNDPDTWAKYTDEAILRLGEPMFHFATGGLPRLVSNSEGIPSAVTPIWVDPLSNSDDEFDDEHNAEELDDRSDDIAQTPKLSRRTQPSQRTRTRHEQARYRKWLHQLAEGLAAAPAIDRSARAGLILISTIVDLWDGPTGTDGWFDLLAEVTKNLAGDDIPDALLPQLASLAAVCLYRLDQAAPADNRGNNATTYQSTVFAVRSLLESADRESVAANAASLDSDDYLPLDPAAIWDHQQAILRADPQADTLRILERSFPEWDISSEHPGRYLVTGRFSNPAKAAAQALVLIEDFPTAVVRAIGSSESQATLIRYQDTLVVASVTGRRLSYRTYRLGTLVNPVGIADGGDMERNARLDPPPWNRPSPTAIAAFDAVGLPTHAIYG